MGRLIVFIKSGCLHVQNSSALWQPTEMVLCEVE